jgi:hypothetical protein
MPNDPAPIPAQPQALAPLAAERQRMAYVLSACPVQEFPERYVEFVARASAVIDAAKELLAMVKERGLEHALEHGEFVVADTLHYPGFDKDTKETDPRLTFEELLRATGGDLDQVKACLKAGAFKHGACKAILDKAAYARCFTTIVKPDLKTGKPKKKLQSTSLTFNRS